MPYSMLFAYVMVMLYWYLSGVVTSACLPCYAGGKLIGVTCVDVVIGELLASATYFHKGELSYVSIIDSRGRTMTHPLLPQPYTITSDPIFVNLVDLERGVGVDAMVTRMRRSVSFLTFRETINRSSLGLESDTSDFFTRGQVAISNTCLHITMPPSN